MKLKISKIGLNTPTAFIGLYTTFILGKVYFIAENNVLFSIVDGLQWMFLLFFAFKLLSRKYSVKLLCILFFVVALFGISYYHCKTSSYLKFALIIVASFGLNYDNFYRDIKQTFMLWGIPLLLLGIVGLIPSTIVRRGYSTYGFVHTNVVAMFVLTAICCFVMERDGKLTRRNYLFIFLIDILLWFLTDTRSSCVIIIVLLLINAFLQTRLFSKVIGFKLVKIIIYSLIPLATIFSFYCAINYGSDNVLIDVMNKMTSNRINMANIVFTRMTPTLFGNYIIGDLVENAYIVSIYQYGIIASALVYLFYVYALGQTIKNKKFGVLSVLICFIIHGIIEASTFEPFVNVALVPIVFSINLSKFKTKGKKNDNNIYSYL